MSDQVKVMELKQQPSGLTLFAMPVGSELVHDTYIWLNNTSELNHDDSHRTFFFFRKNAPYKPSVAIFYFHPKYMNSSLDEILHNSCFTTNIVYLYTGVMHPNNST